MRPCRHVKNPRARHRLAKNIRWKPNTLHRKRAGKLISQLSIRSLHRSLYTPGNRSSPQHSTPQGQSIDSDVLKTELITAKQGFASVLSGLRTRSFGTGGRRFAESAAAVDDSPPRFFFVFAIFPQTRSVAPMGRRSGLTLAERCGVAAAVDRVGVARGRGRKTILKTPRLACLLLSHDRCWK